MPFRHGGHKQQIWWSCCWPVKLARLPDNNIFSQSRTINIEQSILCRLDLRRAHHHQPSQPGILQPCIVMQRSGSLFKTYKIECPMWCNNLALWEVAEKKLYRTGIHIRLPDKNSWLHSNSSPSLVRPLWSAEYIGRGWWCQGKGSAQQRRTPLGPGNTAREDF